MSVPPVRHLPERPSLEQLRKQAKEHLDTLRAGDPSATLATAQHALANEYRFRQLAEAASITSNLCSPSSACCGPRS